MKAAKFLTIAIVLAAGLGQAANAKDKPKQFVVVNEAVGVPVFPYDITDRSYEVIGEVKAGVRKATIFSNEASQEKIYKELWERAEKLGADAVIKAQYGESHVTAFSWGKTNVTGIAVRFVAAAPAPAAASDGASTASEPSSTAPEAAPRTESKDPV